MTKLASWRPVIARFMGPTWGPSGADRTQVGPMLSPWTLQSGTFHFQCMDSLSALLALWERIHRSPMDSPHKGQWRGALMSSLVCAWTNGWANSPGVGDFRRHGAYCDVTVMLLAVYVVFMWCLWSLVPPTHLGYRTWISNYIHCCLRDVTNHSCTYFNVGLAKPLLKLCYGWVITYHGIITYSHSQYITDLRNSHSKRGP